MGLHRDGTFKRECGLQPVLLTGEVRAVLPVAVPLASALHPPFDMKVCRNTCNAGNMSKRTLTSGLCKGRGPQDTSWRRPFPKVQVKDKRKSTPV